MNRRIPETLKRILQLCTVLLHVAEQNSILQEIIKFNNYLDNLELENIEPIKCKHLEYHPRTTEIRLYLCLILNFILKKRSCFTTVVKDSN